MALYLAKECVTFTPEQLGYLPYYKPHNTSIKMYESKQNTSIMLCLTCSSYSFKAYHTSVYLNLHKSRGNLTLPSLSFSTATSLCKQCPGIEFLSQYYYWVISAASVVVTAQNLFLGIWRWTAVIVDCIKYIFIKRKGHNLLETCLMELILFL